MIAVADSYRLMPWAQVVYGCDTSWWEVHQTCGGFAGEKWACHEQDRNPAEIHGNDKRDIADRYGVNLVNGRDGDEFSFDQSFIRYGSNAGFQAINLAILFGATRIVLVGFDMRHVGGKAHFFGDHPPSLRRLDDDGYRGFVKRFERAAKVLPPHISIVNATPGSALTCFPMMDFHAAIQPDGVLHRHRPESHAAAG